MFQLGYFLRNGINNNIQQTSDDDKDLLDLDFSRSSLFNAAKSIFGFSSRSSSTSTDRSNSSEWTLGGMNNTEEKSNRPRANSDENPQWRNSSPTRMERSGAKIWSEKDDSESTADDEEADRVPRQPTPRRNYTVMTMSSLLSATSSPQPEGQRPKCVSSVYMLVSFLIEIFFLSSRVAELLSGTYKKLSDKFNNIRPTEVEGHKVIQPDLLMEIKDFMMYLILANIQSIEWAWSEESAIRSIEIYFLFVVYPLGRNRCRCSAW